MAKNIIYIRQKGSSTSGNYGHAGRPGHLGGSLPKSMALSVRTGPAFIAKPMAQELTATEAAQKILELDNFYHDKWLSLDKKIGELEDKANERMWAAAPDENIQAELEPLFTQMNDLRAQRRRIDDQLQAEVFESVLRVNDPASNKIYLTDNAPYAVKAGAEQFSAMVSQRAMQNAKMMGAGIDVKDERGRSFYNNNGMATLFQKSEPSDRSLKAVTVHELGHWFEDAARTTSYSNAFIKSRLKPGEKPKQLPKSRGYDPGEIVYKDKFFDPYVGKIYTHRATEVISMGMQYMVTNAALFVKDDPDHFKYVYNTLRGKFGVRK